VLRVRGCEQRGNRGAKWELPIQFLTNWKSCPDQEVVLCEMPDIPSPDRISEFGFRGERELNRDRNAQNI